MMKAQTQSMGVSHTGDLLVALSIDGLKLLLPHHEVHTLEPVADVETVEKQDEVVGWFTAGAVKIPIYCFSRHLAVLDTIPDVRRIAVLMTADATTIGILCDDLKIISRKQLNTHPLPQCMKVPGTPLTGLAMQKDTVFCLSSANYMLKYLREGPLLSNTRNSA
jgi:hypothetical protein